VPLFSRSPGQVAFPPGGRELVVTTKSANTVEVFPMTRDGRPARRAVVNDSAGAVPFAITFDKAGRMLVAEAKESTVSTYKVRVDGTLEVVQKSLPHGQSTPCRLERAGDFWRRPRTRSSCTRGTRLPVPSTASASAGTAR
jgi:DNA-binding beta-propeller fold protein YncE